MKLIYCERCRDVFRLNASKRKCACESSGGVYIDNRRVVVWGKAVPFALANEDLLTPAHALRAGNIKTIRSWWIDSDACDAGELMRVEEEPDGSIDFTPAGVNW